MEHGKTTFNTKYVTAGKRGKKHLVSLKPEVNMPVYMHAIELDPLYSVEEESKKQFYKTLFKLGQEFGIVTNCLMPEVSEFSIFLKLLEIKVNIRCNVSCFHLSQEQISSIRNFHTFLFIDVMRIVRPFLTVDLSNNENSYYIVPLQTDFCSIYEIAWDIVQITSFTESTENNTMWEFPNGKIDNVVGAVVTPWYKPCPLDRMYVVTKVRTDLTPSSTFPAENYKTFHDYYKKKHKIDITCEMQPLLEVECIPLSLNLIIPQLWKKKERHGCPTEFLVPQLCVRQEFPSSYWFKSTMLPTILHQMHYLLLAEMLREELFAELHSLSSLSVTSQLLSSFLGQMEITPSEDIFEHIRTNTLFDLTGPLQKELVQAIMTTSFDNGPDFEVLESLGDSFLKFAASLFVYITNPFANEQCLATLTTNLVENQHLSHCATLMHLGSYIKVNKFEPTFSWCPPGFHIPCEIMQMMRNLPLESVLSLRIPEIEQRTGILSSETIEAFRTEILKLDNQNIGSKEEYYTNLLVYIKKQIVSDKTLADSVEAIIGSYFLACGIKPTFVILKYLRILPKCCVDMILQDDLRQNLQPAIGLHYNFPYFAELEERLGYTFRNKSFLIEALTHKCYSTDIHKHYGTMEFLGDAILDILVTSFLYKHCDKKSPGILTCMRSSLVNHVAFSRYSLHIGLHKYILCECEDIKKHINRLTREQDDAFDTNQITYIVNEPNFKLAESIMIPKILSDVFESVAAAMFLDSGKNLDILWKVFYSVMKKELCEFTRTNKIIVNPLHLVTTKYPSAKFNILRHPSCKYGNVAAAVELEKDEKTVIYAGISQNNKEAKIMAAKLVLHDLQEE